MTRSLALIAMLVFIAGAQAHTRSQTNGILSADRNGVRLTLAIEAREVTRATALPGLALPLEQAMRLHFLKEVHVSADGALCPATARAPAFAPVMRMEIEFACPNGWRNLTLTYNAFFDVARGHIAIVHTDVDGEPRGEAVLSKQSRELSLPRAAGQGPTRPAGIVAFLVLGFEHILEGVDHLCFVIGLLLMARSFSAAAIALTGFTLGHSATLALGALDLVRVSPPTVETLIAATILAVGLEALRAHGGASRAVVWAAVCVAAFALAALIMGHAPAGVVLAVAALAFGAALERGNPGSWARPFAFATGFGTIHGLAFAETLREVLTPGAGLIWALLGFNLGVELGQLLVASVVAGLFVAWRRRDPAGARTAAYATACLLLLGGGAWFAARLPFA